MKTNVYETWLKISPSSEIDEDLKAFLCETIDSSARDWIWRARKALCLSGCEMARRLNMSRSNYWRLEQREHEGRISLRSLRKVAEAMDCELVYAIRPKSRKTFSHITWESLLPIAEKHPWVKVVRPEGLQKYFALISTIQRTYLNPRIRQNLGWTRQL